MIARIIPIVLILSAGFFWKYEKQVRIQAEKRLTSVSEQLNQSQKDLMLVRREADTAIEEKRFLIQQLGDRDEHIRRMLAEMIKLLSGSGSVDLGEVFVRTQAPGAWDGVHKELRNITASDPLSTLPVAMPLSRGLGQLQVESNPITAMQSQSSPTTLFGTPSKMAIQPNPDAALLANRSARLLTVNANHRFVVIDQGLENGLRENMTFDAFFGDRKIGRLQVGTVYDRIATASILDGQVTLFREGSPVRLEPSQA